jgi:YHS domain-containing protein
VKDPEVYLKELGVELPCAIHPEKGAVLDSAHRSYVNHEVYFFSSAGARRRFEKDPLRYCGLVTDPVSLERFRPTRASPRADHAGRPYFFASEATRSTFQGDPIAYANPKRKMPKAPMADPGK